MTDDAVPSEELPELAPLAARSAGGTAGGAMRSDNGGLVDISTAAADSAAEVGSAQRRRRQTRFILDWVIVLVIALGAALLIRTFVFQQYYIDGPSMESTLAPSDRVLVNKLSYKLHDVNRGDVVVFDKVSQNGQEVAHDDLIKRVIGLPGETVTIRNCVVFVNESELVEPYLDDELMAQPDPASRCGRWTDRAAELVREGEVFVMGDNRPSSFDSRDFGPIEIEAIRGRAFVVIWPIGSWAWL
ncbi:MAG: signal peptidase I [Actinomycetota bacterium]|nr:MAG: signal peptidase I [Actinomycetota bacterium]